ncbi:MAG: DUF1189 domain-containing protein [Alphaproteobacteria bacterium]|nr:DUF1189 domain-containing protein [Alphaproteobacteria bacterium]
MPSSLLLNAANISMISFFKDLVGTFYSAPFYRQLLSARRGIGLRFLLVAMLFNALGFSSDLYRMASITGFDPWSVFEHMPDLTKEKGRFSVTVEEPYRIDFPRQDEATPFGIVFDTKAPSQTEAEIMKRMTDENIMVLIGSDTITFYNPVQDQFAFQPAARFEDFALTQKEWLEIADLLKGLFVPTLYAVMFTAFFFGHLFSAFLGSMLILIITPLFALDMKLAAAMRISSAAKVPVAFAALFLTPHLIANFLIWLGFVIFALSANKIPKLKPE